MGLPPYWKRRGVRQVRTIRHGRQGDPTPEDHRRPWSLGGETACRGVSPQMTLRLDRTPRGVILRGADRGVASCGRSVTSLPPTPGGDASALPPTPAPAAEQRLSPIVTPRSSFAADLAAISSAGVNHPSLAPHLAGFGRFWPLCGDSPGTPVHQSIARGTMHPPSPEGRPRAQRRQTRRRRFARPGALDGPDPGRRRSRRADPWRRDDPPTPGQTGAPGQAGDSADADVARWGGRLRRVSVGRAEGS
jgi:hypothetical protein